METDSGQCNRRATLVGARTSVGMGMMGVNSAGQRKETVAKSSCYNSLSGGMNVSRLRGDSARGKRSQGREQAEEQLGKPWDGP